MESTELRVPEKKEVSREEETRAGRAFVPSVDVYEAEDRLWLWADMPGVDDRTIDVNLADGVLSIHGDVSLHDYENLSPLYTEYNVGNFHRTFHVSKDIDVDGIRARMVHGVLEIELPKTQAARPRKIDVAVS